MDSSLSAEIWLAVPRFEDLYQVSNRQRVRSLEHWTAAGRRGGRVLRTNLGPNGYPQLTLYRGGTGRTYKLHELVAAAFHGPRPSPEMEVRHLDGNPANNLPENLAWGTPSENSMDSIRHGTHPTASRTHCPRGHPYGGDNLIVRPTGARLCRTCRHEDSVHLARERKVARNSRGPLPREPQTFLTDAEVRDIRAVPPYRGRTVGLARQYGVSESTIDRILKGKTRKSAA